MNRHRGLVVLAWLVLHVAADKMKWADILSSYTEDNITLNPTLSRVIADISRCECDQACRAYLACQGVAYSSALRQCRIAQHQPTLHNTQTSGNQSWLMAHRRNPGMANEDCRLASDCHAIKGNAGCRGGKCGCSLGFRLLFDTCYPADNFGSLPAGAADLSAPLGTLPYTGLEACEWKCLQTTDCLLLSFRHRGDHGCSLFARLTKYSAPSTDVTTDVRARRHPRPDGNPVEPFVDGKPGTWLAGRQFIFVNDMNDGYKADEICRLQDAVLYPAESLLDVEAVFSLLGKGSGTAETQEDDRKYCIHVGLDMLLSSDKVVSSNGKTVFKSKTIFPYNDNWHCVGFGRDKKYKQLACTRKCFSICEYVGSAVGTIRNVDDISAVIHLGAVYDVHAVVYTRDQSSEPVEVHVTVSMVGGEEQVCAVATSEAAAPQARSRKLTCSSPAYGSVVRLLFSKPVAMRREPVVYGTKLYDL